MYHIFELLSWKMVAVSAFLKHRPYFLREIYLVVYLFCSPSVGVR